MPVKNSDSSALKCHCDSDASRLSGSNEIDKKISNFQNYVLKYILIASTPG